MGCIVVLCAGAICMGLTGHPVAMWVHLSFAAGLALAREVTGKS